MTNFSTTVKVKIEYGANASSLYTISTQDLTISYNRAPGTKYNANNYFHFTGAKYVKVTILQPPTAVAGITIEDLVLVQNEMLVTRYLDLGTNLQPFSFGVTTPQAGDDELKASWLWQPGAGHTHTQLEWTWLENEMAPYYYVSGSLNYDKLFRNNSTRIDLPRNIDSFRIPYCTVIPETLLQDQAS